MMAVLWMDNATFHGWKKECTLNFSQGLRSFLANLPKQLMCGVVRCVLGAQIEFVALAEPNPILQFTRGQQLT